MAENRLFHFTANVCKRRNPFILDKQNRLIKSFRKFVKRKNWRESHNSKGGLNRHLIKWLDSWIRNNVLLPHSFNKITKVLKALRMRAHLIRKKKMTVKIRKMIVKKNMVGARTSIWHHYIMLINWTIIGKVTMTNTLIKWETEKICVVFPINSNQDHKMLPLLEFYLENNPRDMANTILKTPFTVMM